MLFTLGPDKTSKITDETKFGVFSMPNLTQKLLYDRKNAMMTRQLERRNKILEELRFDNQSEEVKKEMPNPESKTKKKPKIYKTLCQMYD